MLRTTTIAVGLILASLVGAGAAETVRAVCSAATTISLAYEGKQAPAVFVRAGQGRWTRATARLDQGRLIFELDPAKLGSADITLLIDPPPGLVIDDYRGPELTALELDGRPLKPGGAVDLGNMKEAPRTLKVAFRDAANDVDPAGFGATIDGAALPAGKLRVEPARPGAPTTVRLRLPALDYGRHEIAVIAADTAPQRNLTTAHLAFTYLETGNLALAALGTKVSVDSCFGGYESLAPLNDGVSTMPGDHCGNDISWASAEVAADHWVQMTFAKPASIKEVTVYWAAYTNVAHTARHFEVQVPEGSSWRTVYQSPADGEKPAPLTTARFAPLTATAFRVFVPKGEGSSERPNLMWVGEIKAR